MNSTSTTLLLAVLLALPLSASEEGHSRDPNRLIHEKSPYLLQHAYNPVDWYPWGEEAFEKARVEEKPIFLSIGYSTCHWCHVMEKESFSDPDLAAIINENFVPIKVDREERPDVDALYMAFLMATGGDGGWPANIFLTPDLEPFYGGTYFPPRDRSGRIGLETILLRLTSAWTEHREQIVATGRQMIAAVRSFSAPRSSDEMLGTSVIDHAFEQIAARYDQGYGGFSPAPKFPQPVIHEMLLRYHVRNGSEEAARMSLETLRSMATGGIYDQVAGGFHRYSVDERWVVPHFEKMLYDQAQLVNVYLSALQLTGDEQFETVARETLDFVLDSLTSPDGGFYAALDASSLPTAGAEVKREGAFYTWSYEEIGGIFGAESAPLVAAAFGVEKEGNVAGDLDPTGDLKGTNVLTRRAPVERLAATFELPAEKVRSILDQARSRLRSERSKRPAPHLDDKVLSGWNGLMISAFARGSQVLGEERYLEAASASARFLEKSLWDGKRGKLWRRWRDGEAAVDGFAEDYAFVIHGLLDLYEASFDLHWLELARRLQRRQDEIFWNDERGYYRLTAGKDGSILVDVPGDVDSVLPSHNSVSALNLIRLGQLTGRDDWLDRSTTIIKAFGGTIRTNPQTMPLMVSALSARLAKPKQIIIAGERSSGETATLLELVHDRYLPDHVLILADGSNDQQRLTDWMPFLEFVQPIDGRATAYVCENFTCKLPSNDPEVVARQLDSRPASPTE